MYTQYTLKVATHQLTPTQNMKGMKDNTDDRKRHGQHKRPNTNMGRHGQDKTKMSVQHQPYEAINIEPKRGIYLNSTT